MSCVARVEPVSAAEIAFPRTFSAVSVSAEARPVSATMAIMSSGVIKRRFMVLSLAEEALPDGSPLIDLGHYRANPAARPPQLQGVYSQPASLTGYLLRTANRVVPPCLSQIVLLDVEQPRLRRPIRDKPRGYLRFAALATRPGELSG